LDGDNRFQIVFFGLIMTINNSEAPSKLHGIYVITDQTLTPPDKIEEYVHHAIQGGCSVVQYRDKTSSPAQRLQEALKINALCRKHHILFIVNDDIELAKQSGAHGVHIGKNDVDFILARELLGQNSIIGVSCYNDIQRAVDAEKQGASYVAFGRFFNSQIKPEANQADLDVLTKAKQLINIPIAAIGGIDHTNATSLINAGADMLAVISSVFAQQDIKNATRKLYDCFGS